jgi:cysteine desulfurase
MNYLTSQGFIVDYVKIDDDGCVDLEHLRSLLSNETILVSICAVDSELGIRQPIEKIAEIIREYPKCFFHVDCTQALGKIPIDFNIMDFASLSSHKIYGLKGIGMLIKKKNIMIDNLIHGGKSSTVYRSGTPALPLIVSTMKALDLIIPNIDKNYVYVEKLQRSILNQLKKYDGVFINSTNCSICYTINVSLKNIKPETFVHALDEEDIYISTRSACSNANTMSDAVYAVTKDRDRAMKSIRISLSYLTKEEEVEEFLQVFDRCYQKLNFKG